MLKKRDDYKSLIGKKILFYDTERNDICTCEVTGITDEYQKNGNVISRNTEIGLNVEYDTAHGKEHQEMSINADDDNLFENKEDMSGQIGDCYQKKMDEMEKRKLMKNTDDNIEYIACIIRNMKYGYDMDRYYDCSLDRIKDISDRTDRLYEKIHGYIGDMKRNPELLLKMIERLSDR